MFRSPRSILVAALLLSVAPALHAQGVRMTIGGGDTLSLAELLAEVGLAEDGETLEILAAMPATNRSAAYTTVDLQDGDRVLAFNGKPARKLSELKAAYEAAAVGDTIELGLQRGERRWIARFAKADPASLPQVRRVQIQGNPDDLAMLMGLGVIILRQEGSLRVHTLLPGSPAADHFAAGDVLVSFDGETDLEPSDLQSLWQSIPIGDEVEFTILRGDEELTFSLPKAEAHTGQRVILQ